MSPMGLIGQRSPIGQMGQMGQMSLMGQRSPIGQVYAHRGFLANRGDHSSKKQVPNVGWSVLSSLVQVLGAHGES